MGEWRVTLSSEWLKFVSGRARSLLVVGLIAAMAAVPQAAHAQFSDTYKFLEAVRKSDGAAVTKAIEQPGVTPINTKDRNTGETALHIAVGRRDLTWTNYFLNHGSRVDITDAAGRSPLMVAVEKRFAEGVQLLLAKKANPNQGNDSGETPLIRAVQFGDIETVRLLLGAGADPNRKDTAAGMSAIDYAKRDNRIPGLVDILTANAKVAPAKGVQGPHL
jgi:ankyrin repeat protein